MRTLKCNKCKKSYILSDDEIKNDYKESWNFPKITLCSNCKRKQTNSTFSKKHLTDEMKEFMEFMFVGQKIHMLQRMG